LNIVSHTFKTRTHTHTLQTPVSYLHLQTMHTLSITHDSRSLQLQLPPTRSHPFKIKAHQSGVPGRAHDALAVGGPGAALDEHLLVALLRERVPHADRLPLVGGRHLKELQTPGRRRLSRPKIPERLRAAVEEVVPSRCRRWRTWTRRRRRGRNSSG